MSSSAPFEFSAAGTRLPPIVFGPVDRTLLALYAAASGDHNPLHIDSDFAKREGFDDVFVHGSLPMAYLAEALSRWLPGANTDRLSVRFTAIAHVHDSVECSGEIVSGGASVGGGETCLIRVCAATADGRILITGEAHLTFGGPEHPIAGKTFSHDHASKGDST